MNVFALSLIVLILATMLASRASFAGPSNETKANVLFQEATANSAKPAKRNVALKQINEAIKIDPQNANFYNLKGSILADNDYDEALISLDKALQIDPQLAQAWYTKSEILMHQNKPELALQAADKAVACSPKLRSIRIKPLKQLRRYEEAMKEAEIFVSVFPKNDVVLLMHSDMARQLKRWPIVVKDETRLIELRKEIGSGHLLHKRLRADAYVALRQYEKAIADLEDVVRENPVNRKAHKLLLEIYRKKNDKKNIAKEEAILAKLEMRQFAD